MGFMCPTQSVQRLKGIYFQQSAELWEPGGDRAGTGACPAPRGGQCAAHGQLERMDLEIPINSWSRRHKRNSPNARRRVGDSCWSGPCDPLGNAWGCPNGTGASR